MVRRRRPLASSVLPVPAPAAPLDNDDLLREILLHLPPRPSSLLRASVVCKRWRRLVSDPGFLRRFRAHHRKPPLLGFFCADTDAGYCFTPTLDPPDRIPTARFSLPHSLGESLDFVECRHGLALFLDKKQPEAVVWNPISGRQRRVAVPPEFDNTVERDALYAAVLCAAVDDDHGHVHGDCDLNSFKLALVRSGKEDYTLVFACLYESKSGEWGNVFSTTTTEGLMIFRKPSVLVGNAFCWLLSGEKELEGDILEFDFEMQKLVVIENPLDRQITDGPLYQIMRTEESSLGLIVYTRQTIQLWERKVNSDDVSRWVLQRTIDLAKHLPSGQVDWRWIHGYDEDHKIIFLWASNGSLMIQLDSMQFDSYFGTEPFSNYFPYTSFYAADWATGGRDDGPEMLSSTRPDCPNR